MGAFCCCIFIVFTIYESNRRPKIKYHRDPEFIWIVRTFFCCFFSDSEMKERDTVSNQANCLLFWVQVRFFVFCILLALNVAILAIAAHNLNKLHDALLTIIILSSIGSLITMLIGFCSMITEADVITGFTSTIQDPEALVELTQLAVEARNRRNF
jgi:FtsH-binding integral membrane protein